MYPIRINKFLTYANYCSRRQADRLIKDGKVKINGRKARLGQKILANDKVFVGKKLISIKDKKKVYLVFNKPVGIICTSSEKSKDNIIDYINYPERIYPIGRLDVKSSGLILLTNDGEIVNKILKAQGNIEKEYLVEVNNKINDKFLSILRSGVIIDENYKTLPAKVKVASDRKFLITLIEGKNKQIRKMCEKLGYDVLKIKRVRIGKIFLKNLKEGNYIKMSESLVKKLLKI